MLVVDQFGPPWEGNYEIYVRFRIEEQLRRITLRMQNKWRSTIYFVSTVLSTSKRTRTTIHSYSTTALRFTFPSEKRCSYYSTTITVLFLPIEKGIY